MTAFLLALILSAQGIPVLPNQSGTITGILKTAGGKPAVGVRVAAVARPDSLQEATTGAAFASLAQTDEAGRYRLESVPPGRYYIAAGRVDLQTYYPGTLEMASSTVVLIVPGTVLSDIDFAMKDASGGRATNDFILTSASVAAIPLKVTVEGGKVPVFSPRGFPMIVLARVADGARVRSTLNVTSLAIPTPPSAPEYQVLIENLPDGYALKSLVYGSTDLVTGTLRIPMANFSTSTTAALLAQQFLSQLIVVSATPPPSPPPPPLSTLNVTLTVTPSSPATATGVRISGQSSGPNEPRSVYISGTPGTFYSDGSFEFRGVPAGRHVVITGAGPRVMKPLGAVVIVGDRDVDRVSLEEIFVPPADFQSPSSPGPVDANTPGSTVRLASLRGRVVEETTRQPIAEGTVRIIGGEGDSLRLQPDGRFEIPRLLPGNYKLQIVVFGHTNVNQDLVIGQDDVNLDLTARRLN